MWVLLGVRTHLLLALLLLELALVRVFVALLLSGGAGSGAALLACMVVGAGERVVGLRLLVKTLHRTGGGHTGAAHRHRFCASMRCCKHR